MLCRGHLVSIGDLFQHPPSLPISVENQIHGQSTLAFPDATSQMCLLVTSQRCSESCGGRVWPAWALKAFRHVQKALPIFSQNWKCPLAVHSLLAPQNTSWKQPEDTSSYIQEVYEELNGAKSTDKEAPLYMLTVNIRRISRKHTAK